MPGSMVGIPRTSMGFGGRFGMTPPNATAPGGSAMASPVQAGVDVAWYESGPFWVIVFLVVGYILVFQTLKS